MLMILNIISKGNLFSDIASYVYSLIGLLYSILLLIIIITNDYVLVVCRGVIACVMAFLMIGVTQTPDGPFCRPHPGKLH